MFSTLNEVALEHHKILLCVSKSLLGMMEAEACWVLRNGAGRKELDARPSSACLGGFEEDTPLLSIHNKMYRQFIADKMY